MTRSAQRSYVCQEVICYEKEEYYFQDCPNRAALALTHSSSGSSGGRKQASLVRSPPPGGRGRRQSTSSLESLEDVNSGGKGRGRWKGR